MDKLQAIDKPSKNFDAWLGSIWNDDKERDWDFFQKEGPA
jgi:hypothetical protein